MHLSTAIFPGPNVLLSMIIQHYHQISNISRTQSQNVNVFRLILQLPLPNPLKPGVKSGMKM